MTYFSCGFRYFYVFILILGEGFDRGDRGDLSVIAVDLAVKCTSRRHQRWTLYVGFMIGIWPVGATLCLAALLWRNRFKLNPTTAQVRAHIDEMSGSQQRRRTSQTNTTLSDGFDRERRRHARAMDEISKLDLRNADSTIAGLEFLFEE